MSRHSTTSDLKKKVIPRNLRQRVEINELKKEKLYLIKPKYGYLKRLV